MKFYLDEIIDTINTGICMRDIAQYWQFRSTVPGPGLQQASAFLCDRYRQAGIDAEVIRYPADDCTISVDERKNPLMWVPRDAQLEIVTQEGALHDICSYANEPLSLISNSTATPYEGITASVIEIPDAHIEESYKGLDVKGKIILTSSMSYLVEPLAKKYEAAGLITDCICPPWLYTGFPPPRQPEDVPDLTMWATFNGQNDNHGLWGFNLTPRQGRFLRDLVQHSTEPLQLRAVVDADLVPGTSEVVSALLPGTDLAGEEIWVLTHSSEPGAEDNASGCCAAVEVAHTLSTLIAKGKLPPPRRSIRFLSAVEVNGYLPYLHERRQELHHVIAGIAPDCVGNDFTKCGGQVDIACTPDTNPSFIDSLLLSIVNAVIAVPNHRFTTDTYAMYPYRVMPYLGNDAFISDPYFDIPTTQISTWPEKYYHSAMDTPDKLCANTLGRSIAIVAAYVYFLATAGVREAMECNLQTTRDWKQRILRELGSTALKSDADLLTQSRHLALLGCEAANSILRLAPNDPCLQDAVTTGQNDIKRFAAQEAESVLHLTRNQASTSKLHISPPDNDAVYKRLRWEPPKDATLSPKSRANLKVLRDRYPKIDRVWTWIDGRRTVQEIWWHLQAESALEADALETYLGLMESGNYIKISEHQMG